MNILRSIVLALAVAAATAACAHTAPGGVTDPTAPRMLETGDPVAVEWTDPAGFSEIRTSFNRLEASRGNWVHDLAEHLRDGIQARIGEDEHVQVLITDIDRAGDFEPQRGPQMDHVRIMRDIHWPRMSLECEQRDASGTVVNGGARQLSDPSYLHATQGRAGHDPLRYEKTMIDRWLRQEFGPAR
ncbi:MAG: DUF3016 domain-containing protein [Gammaproteobacteria bacterium]|nr:DUF3016 domain-containing protein [Gammaproteobacteria bacterium]